LKYTLFFLLVLPVLAFPQINSNLFDNSSINIGAEYLSNNELGLNGQFCFKNIVSIGLNVKYCKHNEEVVFTPGVRYYFNDSQYKPYIEFRYGKLHYNQEWSKYVEDTIEYWDPTVGGFVSTPNRYKTSGKDKIVTPALLLLGGLEYIIDKIGIYGSLGFSHYTKIDGSFSDKTKFIYAIGLSYYLKQY